MSAKAAAVIGSLVFLLTALAVSTAQTYQLDDPVPPGSVFRIIDLESRVIDLESRIIDLQFRVEAALDVVAKPLDAKGARPGVASGPHSTMSSDFLYLPANPDAVATLTIRVADGQGQPLQGKRVQVKSALSGGPADTIIQPEAPTDARGIATARVKPTTPPHTARFSARVLQDNVDIGQVVEIEVQNPGPPSFFPPAFAPYFDAESFHVNPMPLKVGQPTTFRVPLTNRRQVPVEIRVRFFATVLNIGLGHWPQIGETETFVLQPGESREAKIMWTPTVESGYQCYKVEVWGRELPPRAAAGPWPGWLHLVRSAFAQTPTPSPTATTPALMASRQRNLGPVTPKCDPDKRGLCSAAAAARATISQMIDVDFHTPTPQEWQQTLEKHASTLAGQLGSLRDGLCEEDAARSQVQEVIDSLGSLKPGAATTGGEVVKDQRKVVAIDLYLETLSKGSCVASSPPPPIARKPKPCDDDLLPDWKKPWWCWGKIFDFIWDWFEDVHGPDPFPPGFDPLDPDLAPPAIEGYIDRLKEEKARQALPNMEEYRRIRNLTREEFIREFGPPREVVIPQSRHR